MIRIRKGEPKLVHWRIVPVSKWLVSMVILSPLNKSGCGTPTIWPFISFYGLEIGVILTAYKVLGAHPPL